SFYLWRGNVFSAMGQDKRAIDDFDKSLELKPGTAEVLARRGIAKLELKQNDAGLADLGKALESDPKNADFLVERGIGYDMTGNYPAALADFDAAVAAN